jgi:regulator of sigma E protease
MAYLSNASNILMLAFGFGFVIFWHELGHFLAAKWADVKVEQFAVGFGQAVVCWRKGLGFTWGTSAAQYQKRLKDHIASKQPSDAQLKLLSTPTEAELSAAARELGISETEYRLNWIPLGGYVKMLGQDDLKPGQTVTDPRSYNNKSIGQRMVIVSAGVVMNIILAAIGFMYIFTVGFEVPTARVGLVQPGSPAQMTYRKEGGKDVSVPLQVGDVIESLNGREMSDFEKIRLNTALLIAGEPVPLKVKHPDGVEEVLYVKPEKASGDSQFPAIGVGGYEILKGPPKDAKLVDAGGAELPDLDTIKNGDIVTEINGAPVGEDDYAKLDAAIQAAAGKPVKITIKNAAGVPRPATLYPHFEARFGGEPVNFLGMEMLTCIESIQPKSPVLNILKPGDVIINIADPSPSGGQTAYPTLEQVKDLISQAGEHKIQLKMTVLRGGQPMEFTVDPSFKIAPGQKGLGIGMDSDEDTPIVAGVLDDSPAKAAGVRPGSTLVAINNTQVHNWFEVNHFLGTLKPGEPVQVSATYNGQPISYSIKPLDEKQIETVKQNRLMSYGIANLQPDLYIRKASNPVIAAEWGVGETRDAILQVYQTVRSMGRGSISVKEVSGPVGILAAGYRVAEKGTTRLIWFLSIISANLAVMNFLPIPIVDGGLFTFLIIEKLKGSPISPRMQTIAQAVGLVLLLSVFVFATYQDVARLPMMFK